MARISSVSKRLAKGSKDSYKFIWIVVGIFLAAIIIFAVFFPRKFHSQGNPLVPEAFDNFGDLMENLDSNEEQMVKGILSSKKPTFVMFYADWCGACKNAKPSFQEFMELLKKNGSRVTAELVNADNYRDLVKDHNINSYPTIKYFPEGPANSSKFVEYTGLRTVDDFKKFIDQQN